MRDDTLDVDLIGLRVDYTFRWKRLARLSASGHRRYRSSAGWIDIAWMRYWDGMKYDINAGLWWRRRPAKWFGY